MKKQPFLDLSEASTSRRSRSLSTNSSAEQIEENDVVEDLVADADSADTTESSKQQQPSSEQNDVVLAEFIFDKNTGVQIENSEVGNEQVGIYILHNALKCTTI